MIFYEESAARCIYRKTAQPHTHIARKGRVRKGEKGLALSLSRSKIRKGSLAFRWVPHTCVIHRGETFLYP